MDPLTVLGVAPDASPEEVHAAYRRQAKRLHPDHAGDGPEAGRAMAELNLAYATVRDGLAGARGDRGASGGRRAGAAATARGPAPKPVAGWWLSERQRTRIGPELRGALQREEPVEDTFACATWASPRTLLLLTDRRLLWLLDDAITNRVRSLAWRDVERVHVRPRRFLRRRAAVVVSTSRGKDVAFAELRPEDARRLGVLVARRCGLPPVARVA